MVFLGWVHSDKLLFTRFAERDRNYLSLYDWLFGDEPTHFEARLLRDISETIEGFKLEQGYLFSREHFRDEAFKIRMAAGMSTPAFLKMLRLSERYLDEAQSKRRSAIRVLTRND